MDTKGLNTICFLNISTLVLIKYFSHLGIWSRNFSLYHCAITFTFQYSNLWVYNILKDFENASLVLLLLTLRIQDISKKNTFELKSTASLLNFDTKSETSTPVINGIHNEFKRYSESNKTKVWGRQIFIRYNMISGKKTPTVKQMLLICFHLH